VPSVTTALPSLSDQAERLIEFDVHRIAGLPADRLRNMADSAGSLLVVHPDLAPASDEFTSISSVKLPDAPLYLIRDLDRGDAMANWSPDEA
jgi:hypothetical protein